MDCNPPSENRSISMWPPGTGSGSALGTVVFQIQTRHLVVPLLLALIGTYLAYTGGERILRQRRAVATFEPVDATVTDSDLTTLGREGASQTYQPQITYRYEYDGTRYTSETVYPGGNYDSRDREGVLRLVDGHNAGDRVTAYVDPDAPDRSYLVAGELRTAGLFLGSGIVLVLVAIGLVAYASTM